MYKIVEKLGQGAFGIVYRLQLNNADEFALKVADVGRVQSEMIDSITEARLMLKLSHAHLVQCCSSFTSGRHIYLIMELCNHGTLKNCLSTRTKLVREAQVLAWLGQMADALRYLHVCRVIHRDLKTDNIFLDDRKNVKIGDLGIAREMDYTAQKAGTFIGTFCYMSPEILRSSTYSYKTDIWSLGCCIHEVMTLRVTFAAQSMRDVMENIIKARIPAMSDVYSKELQNLVLNLLQRKPERRPDELEILLAVSRIQGVPFKSGLHLPLDRVQINQKLLVMTVQDFEQKCSLGDSSTSSSVTSLTGPAGVRERESDKSDERKESKDVDFVQENILRAKLQPRPLPRPRHIRRPVAVSPESDITITTNYNHHKQERKIRVASSSEPQHQETDHNTKVQHKLATSKSSSSTDQSPENGSASSVLSSASDSTSYNLITLVSHLQALQSPDDESEHSDGTIVMNGRNSDLSDVRSDMGLKLNSGAAEGTNREENEIGSDDEGLVTLYTRAQMARYNNKRGNSVKPNTEKTAW